MKYNTKTNKKSLNPREPTELLRKKVTEKTSDAKMTISTSSKMVSPRDMHGVKVPISATLEKGEHNVGANEALAYDDME